MANDKAIAAISTTTASKFAPTSVLAKMQKSWPAPVPTPGIDISEVGRQTLPVHKRSARTVIGASIFGGPVTSGDPEVVTANISPYTEKAETPHPALEESEGYQDVFGMKHGAEVPAGKRFGGGRGAFDVPTPMGALDTSKWNKDYYMAAREYAKRNADQTKNGAEESFFEKNMIAIGVATVAAVGLGAWYFTKKK